jgi:hypothetical protein
MFNIEVSVDEANTSLVLHPNAILSLVGDFNLVEQIIRNTNVVKDTQAQLEFITIIYVESVETSEDGSKNTAFYIELSDINGMLEYELNVLGDDNTPIKSSEFPNLNLEEVIAKLKQIYNI